jgi:transcriptional regulator with PAS, ATPase and Fis domain
MSLTVINPEKAPSSPRGVLVIDTEKRIVYVDQPAAEILGSKPEDLIGRTCSDFISLLPCANGVCGLDTPCRLLEEGKPGEVALRSNDRCAFESRIATNASGERLGTIHVVTLPKPSAQLSSFRASDAFEGMIGQHPSMKKLFELAALVAGTDVTVHIYGQSGAGKELVAEAIHRLSPRSQKRLVKLNCSTIPATLLESTLFGHAKGSFTGANKDTEGFVEYAEGGTLFLDEIGDVSHDVQIKLLRLLESREFSRVGETRTRFADIRIVTASNRDLRQLVDQGNIREDFFYRINVFPLTIPALKERRSDVPILANHFVARFNKRLRKNILSISPEALAMLERYDWPGNVRELQHAIEHAFVKAANGFLLPEHFPPFEGTSLTAAIPVEPVEKDSGKVLDEASIRRELAATNGNASKAAKRLGVSRVTLWKHMKRLGVTR